MNKKLIFGSSLALALFASFLYGRNVNSYLSTNIDVTNAAKLDKQNEEADSISSSKNNNQTKDENKAKPKSSTKIDERSDKKTDSKATTNLWQKANKYYRSHFYKTGIDKIKGTEFNGYKFSSEELTKAKANLIQLGFSNASNDDTVRILALAKKHHWTLKHAAYEYYL